MDSSDSRSTGAFRDRIPARDRFVACLRIARTEWPWILIVAVAAAWIRGRFLSDWEHNFDADEALIAVQAREILQGRFSLFLPGQKYMGSLQSLIAAPLLAIFGNHAMAVRLSPLLWVVPGLLALLALERLEDGPLAAGRGARLLALFWFFPPAVLFLAGLKARGGNLEGLVLGLWAMVLLWPRRNPSSRRTPCWNRLRRWNSQGRWLCGGLLVGLGFWTHEQVAILLPLVAAFLFVEDEKRIRRALAFAVGALAGYLPLWLPKLAAFGLGPPGLAGTDWAPEPAALFTGAALRHACQAVAAALTTRPVVASGQGATTAFWILHVVAIVICAVFALLPGFRRTARHAGEERRPWWRVSPALTVSLWLAAGTLGALLVSPGYFGDPQWFRYTLGMAPLLAVIPALALGRLGRMPAFILAALLAILFAWSALRAVPGWTTPHAAERAPLAASLVQQGIDRVETDWQLAYVLRFLTRDRVLCSSLTPPRFPEVNAAVDLAPSAWLVRARARSPASGAIGDWPDPVDPSVADAFVLQRRRENPPADVCAAFADLDPTRTLFPHFEPYPLLRPGEYRRDWKGWPYRRPLRRFQTIVWNPGMSIDVAPGRVEQALDQLVASGEFVLAADGSGWRILRRRQ